MTSQKKKQTPKISSTQKRTTEQKALMVETLEKVPVIQVACKRVGISRATFYRWKEEDHDFALAVSNATHEGNLSINDLAQSKLIELINKGHLTAIIFWLKSRDSSFVEKRKIDFKHETIMNTPVSKETIELIQKAMGNYHKKRLENEEMEKTGTLPSSSDPNDEDDEEEFDLD